MGYESETSALLSRFSDTLTIDEEIAWDNYIYKLKYSGLLYKAHALSIFKNHGHSADSLINIIGDYHNITMNNSPSFNSTTGWTFDSLSSQYGTWDVTPSDDSNINFENITIGVKTGSQALSSILQQALFGVSNGSNTTTLYQSALNGIVAGVQVLASTFTDLPQPTIDINSFHSISFKLDNETTGTLEYRVDGVTIFSEAGLNQSSTLASISLLLGATNNNGVPVFYADVVLESAYIFEYLSEEEEQEMQTSTEEVFSEMPSAGNRQESNSTVANGTNTDAVIARFSDTLTEDEEIAYDNLFYALEKTGLDSKTHALSIFKNHGDSDDSLLNLIEDDHNITMNNTPTFNAATGWTLDSASSQYGNWDVILSVDTNIDPADITMFAGIGNQALSGSAQNALFGATGGSNTTALYQRGGNGITAQVQGAGGNVNDTPSPEFDVNQYHTLSYDGADVVVRNGGTEISRVTASQSLTLAAVDMLIGAANNNGTPVFHSDVILEYVAITDYLTADEERLFNLAIERFFNEIGSSNNVQERANTPYFALEAYYPFSGNANDESGNSNNATVSGATLDTSFKNEENSAYSFDGINDYIELPSAVTSAISGDTNRTICFWVYLETTATGPDVLFAYGDSGTGEKLTLRLTSSELRVEIAGSGYDTALSVPKEQWTFIAVRLDGTTLADVDVFMNTLKESCTGAGTINTLTTNDIRIGSSGITASREIAGIFDEFRVFSRALTDAEIVEVMQDISNHYTAEDFGLVDADLHGFYDPNDFSTLTFDSDGRITNINDKSGNDRHLAFAGAVSSSHNYILDYDVVLGNFYMKINNGNLGFQYEPGDGVDTIDDPMMVYSFVKSESAGVEYLWDSAYSSPRNYAYHNSSSELNFHYVNGGESYALSNTEWEKWHLYFADLLDTTGGGAKYDDVASGDAFVDTHGTPNAARGFNGISWGCAHTNSSGGVSLGILLITVSLSTGKQDDVSNGFRNNYSQFYGSNAALTQGSEISGTLTDVGSSTSPITSDLSLDTNIGADLNAIGELTVDLLLDTVISASLADALEGLMFSDLLQSTVIVSDLIGKVLPVSNINSTTNINAVLSSVVEISSDINNSNNIIADLDFTNLITSDLLSGTNILTDLTGAGLIESDILNETDIISALVSNIPANLLGNSNVSATISSVVAISSDLNGISTILLTVKEFDNIVSNIILSSNISGDLEAIANLESDITQNSEINGLLKGLSNVVCNISNNTEIDVDGFITTNIFSNIINDNSLEANALNVSEQTISANLSGSSDVLGSPVSDLNGIISQTNNVSGVLINGVQLGMNIPGSSLLEGSLVSIGRISCNINDQGSSFSPNLINLNFKPTIIKHLYNVYQGTNKINKMYIDDIEIV